MYVFPANVTLVLAYYTLLSQYHQITTTQNTIVDPGGGGGTYDGQCTMLGGLDPHFRAWLDPLDPHFEPGSIDLLLAPPPQYIAKISPISASRHEIPPWVLIILERPTLNNLRR